jgi:hypothetical protein
MTAIDFGGKHDANQTGHSACTKRLGLTAKGAAPWNEGIGNHQHPCFNQNIPAGAAGVILTLQVLLYGTV